MSLREFFCVKQVRLNMRILLQFYVASEVALTLGLILAWSEDSMLWGCSSLVSVLPWFVLNVASQVGRFFTSELEGSLGLF